jgi:hypothetical protein
MMILLHRELGAFQASSCGDRIDIISRVRALSFSGRLSWKMREDCKRRILTDMTG